MHANELACTRSVRACAPMSTRAQIDACVYADEHACTRSCTPAKRRAAAQRLRAFTMAPATVEDPELSSRYEGGPKMTTMQWRPFYVALELDPDYTDTSKWGNQRKVRKWISFEDLQEWHPDFMKDRY